MADIRQESGQTLVQVAHAGFPHDVQMALGMHVPQALEQQHVRRETKENPASRQESPSALSCREWPSPSQGAYKPTSIPNSPSIRPTDSSMSSGKVLAVP